MNNEITKYKEVNDIIIVLLSKVKEILGEQFVAMYIHGSLAVGDFNVKSSDIDFLVVTKNGVSMDVFNSLKKMHLEILAMENKWANKLEGSYIPKQLLNTYEPPKEPRPYVNEGEFCLEHYGYEWILEQYTIREYGIAIEGPDPKNMINPISSADLKKVSLILLKNWWVPMVKDTSRLKESHYQPYAILTMCRSLYMYDHGAVVSKQVAAKWAINTVDKRWNLLIEKAMSWENGFSFDSMEETKEFIKFTLEYTKIMI